MIKNVLILLGIFTPMTARDVADDIINRMFKIKNKIIKIDDKIEYYMKKREMLVNDMILVSNQYKDVFDKSKTGKQDKKND